MSLQKASSGYEFPLSDLSLLLIAPFRSIKDLVLESPDCDDSNFILAIYNCKMHLNMSKVTQMRFLKLNKRRPNIFVKAELYNLRSIFSRWRGKTKHQELHLTKVCLPGLTSHLQLVIASPGAAPFIM